MKTRPGVVRRIRAEYLEMPGLRLTAEQVQRLCGLDQTMCQTVLDELVTAKFLCVKPDGHYVRLTEGHFPNPQPVNATLRREKRSAKAS
jgi:hypothetical protein